MAPSVVSSVRAKSSLAADRTRKWVTAHPVLVIGAALIAAQLAFRGWALYGSWFQFDDFSFMSRMMDEGVTWSSLMRPYAGHVMPAGFFLSWLNNEIDPLNFVLPATMLLVMQAAASIGCLRLLRSAFGERLGIVPPLAFYLFSIITLPAFIWWAAGINQLPLQIAFFYGTHCHLTYLRTRRRRYALATAAWMLAGLCFYEKTLLLYGVFAIIAFAYFTAGDTGSRLRQLWANYRTGVLLHGVMGAGYLALYVAYGLNFDPNGADDHPLAPVAMKLAGTAFATGAVGGPFRWDFPNEIFAIAHPTDVVITLSWIAIAGLAVHSVHVRSKAKRAGAIIAFALVADIMLVAAGRASFVGPTIALDYRYQTELAGLVALALGLCLMPLVGATEQVEETKPSPFFGNRDRVMAVTAVFVAAAAYSSYLYIDHWQHATQSKTYFTNIEADLKARSDVVPLVDQGVPDFLMWAFAYPENATSHVLRMFEDETTYPKLIADQLFTVDLEGHVRPAVIDVVRRAVPGPTEGCGYRLRPKPVVIPFDGPVVGGGWWLRIGYIANRDSPVTFHVGDASINTQVEPGVHSLYLEVGGEFESFEVSGLAAGTRVCTDDVTLGLTVPYEGPL